MVCDACRAAVVVSQSVGEQIRYFHSGMHTPSAAELIGESERECGRRLLPPSLSAIMRTEEGKGERGREREAVGPTNREQRERERERENAVINRLRDVFARAHTNEAADDVEP